ncbi:MAG TPA: NnrU family protein [Nevskia sp.]|nr:NnrU family protein [Nevskia sp.]
MHLLIASSALWVALHIGLAGTALRGAVAGRIGEQGFRGLFSAASIAVFALLVYAFIHAPRTPLWVAPEGLRWGLAALMLPAAFLLLGSLFTISIKPEDAGTRRDGTRGVLRLTRHPMLCAFALWAALHIIGTGELAATVFFGAFLVTAAAGMPSIDAKYARRNPGAWQRFAAATSILPGAAILAGRNRLVWSEIGWLLPLASLALWATLLLLHQKMTGVAPVPLPWAS